MRFENRFIDLFEDVRAPGNVIGQRSPAGVCRLGVDSERVIGIDGGALRIQPLLKPGWGRSGLAYGPFLRENGLAFAVVLLNGHNTSQTGPLADSIPRRIFRWARGSETEPIARRLLRWLKTDHRPIFLRQLRRWLQIARTHPGTTPMDENLSVGWYAQALPARPDLDGAAFTVHAAGPENGELWVRSASRPLPVARGLQNIPLLYLVVLRERGAAYYISSFPQARGAAAFPLVRPLAVDWQDSTTQVYAGVHQSVLGQIGFRVDTRVYSTQVTALPEYQQWYGTAHAADRLSGTGALAESQAEFGGSWAIASGRFTRLEQGLRAGEPNSMAVLNPGVPSGLVSILVEPAGERGEVCLLWRWQDPENHWRLRAGSDGCSLERINEGNCSVVAESRRPVMQTAREYCLQILDDGEEIITSANGKPLFDSPVTDRQLALATGVGLLVESPEHCSTLRFFEAHPRAVTLPTGILLCLPPEHSGRHVLVSDSFTGTRADLQDKLTSIGPAWRRTIGDGVFEQPVSGLVRVKASVESPCPGRTAYTIDWPQRDFADIQVTITPPGTDRGQGEKGRGGLIFWQDADNYITISTWLDDIYAGASISSFFYLNGFEELYDAVWTNVGCRVTWGKPFVLRVTFDGLLYTAFVNDEPVLYRSLVDVYPHARPLKIHRVGIVSNWEWGNDTGSTFQHFCARTKG
jgi:hypothetical protein